MGLEQRAFRDFPLNDQEILVRHFHKTVADWVDDHAARARRGAATMTDALLPPAFADLEPWAVDLVSADGARAMGAAPGELAWTSCRRSTTRFFPRAEDAIA